MSCLIVTVPLCVAIAPALPGWLKVQGAWNFPNEASVAKVHHKRSHCGIPVQASCQT